MSPQQTFVMAFELTPGADDMRLDELISEAEAERVPDLLTEHQLVLAGPVSWQMDPDEHTPHLIGRAQVVQWDGRGGYDETRAGVA